LKALVLLQNAWSPLYAGREWPRDAWLRELWRSRSGNMLSALIEAATGWDIYPANVSPIVPANADDLPQADLEHLFSELRSQRPDRVIVCGTIALDAALRLWQMMPTKETEAPVMALPHPAWRNCRKQYFAIAGQRLKRPRWDGVIRLRCPKMFATSWERLNGGIWQPAGAAELVNT